MSQMSIHHKTCPHCGSLEFIKKGYFYKRSTKTYIPRFHCLDCKKNFSTRTLSQAFGQKKSHLNKPLSQLFSSGVSIREAARIVGCNYKTAFAKFKWMGELAMSCALEQEYKSTEIEFDELITIEHTKLKPLSVLIAVDENYKIVASEVAKIKAFGHLAEISTQKYGPRPNESKEKLQSLLKQVATQCKYIQLIKSDKNPHYQSAVKSHFAKKTHLTFLSDDKKEKTREQRYLNHNKRTFDPLFKVNHTCAKLRDHIKRLTRRSWCTTKKPENLRLAIYLYIAKTNNLNIFA